ncbi:3-phosphoshikimate 1-carboxyvinyltransferase [Oscillospiraceae bacterium PP1C4]
MSDIRVYPARLCGEITAPPSKSEAHRALICAALAAGDSIVSPLSASEDMIATAQVLRAMGMQITREAGSAAVRGGTCAKGEVTLDCKESGSTLRFLLPVAAALGLQAVFCGEGRLPERPIGTLSNQLKEHGITFSAERMPFTISGKLTGGCFTLPGDVSSQFVSGLLFALPLVDSDSEIVLTSPLQSAGYVDMTLSTLRQSGIEIIITENGYRINGNQVYRAGDKAVEGDYSNAAFWLCAGAIGGEISVGGLDADSMQGDRAIVEVIRRFGGTIATENSIVTSGKTPLSGCRIDAAPIPDLVPVIAVMAAFAQGNTEIYNAARLRIKESDRLQAVSALLRNLGGKVDEYPDRLVIHGGGLRGGEADGANDHRIIMAAAVAAQLCSEPVIIRGAQAVNKSYPNFFDDLIKLGGRCDVI